MSDLSRAERLLRKIEAMPDEAYKIKAVDDALREASPAALEPRHTEGQGEVCDPSCPHWAWANERPTVLHAEWWYAVGRCAERHADLPKIERPCPDCLATAGDVVPPDHFPDEEAAPRADCEGLDVKRLARAMRACAGPVAKAAIPWEGWIASAEPLAAEYARLTEKEERG